MKLQKLIALCAVAATGLTLASCDNSAKGSESTSSEAASSEEASSEVVTATTVTYKNAEGTDAKSYIDTHGEWYYTQVDAHNLKVLKADGTESAQAINLASGYFKTEGKYWAGDNYPLGWAGNMAAINTMVTGKVLTQDMIDGATKADEANDAGLKLWTVDGAVTGATLTDLKDYLNEVLAAYNIALTSTETTKTGTAYASVHGAGYLGKCTVTLDADNKIASTSFDEAFYANTFFDLTSVETVATDIETVKANVTSHGATSVHTFAKSIKIGDVVFTATAE